jgi:large subunit ribosomal protein L21
MYAVVESGSKTYRVAAGDTLVVDRLPTAEAGQPYTFERVLLVSDEGKISVGHPTVNKAAVLADVVEHKRGPKVVAFKMKRRKGYHRTVGHRQELTVLKIKEIKL